MIACVNEHMNEHCGYIRFVTQLNALLIGNLKRLEINALCLIDFYTLHQGSAIKYLIQLKLY